MALFSPRAAPADRDLRAARQAARRGAGRSTRALAPRERAAPCSGAQLRRLTCASQPFLAISGDSRAATVPGQYVPIGFARYVSPVIDPGAYTFYQIAGARMAVPRSTPGCQVADLIKRFYTYGPGSIGYVPLGDTYVPAILSPGDRFSLAGADISELEQQV